MKKINYIIVLLLVLLPMGLFAQSYPLRVILTSKANLTPNIGELKENPSKFINVSIANNMAGAKNQKIYLEMKLKQISPKQDVFVKSNKYLRPIEGMDVKANSVTQLNAQQFNANFSTHTFTDFELQGLSVNSVSDVTDLSSLFTLPEGIYQFCLIAYDFDSPIEGEPVLLSDPEASCLMVKVCYKANSPKWIEPVNCLYDIDCFDKVVSPARMIRFSWTPVNNSCGVNIGTLDYTVKLFQVLEGQTAEEAVIINPPKYIWENINGTNLIVDTMSIQNIFVRGEKYAIQVSLDPEHKDRIAEKLVLENEGLSKAVSFFYGESNIAENSEDKENKDKDKEEKKPEFEQEIDRDIRLVVTDVDCGITLPANQIPIESLSPKDEVMIDKFPMIIKEITKNDSTKLYKGTGIIRKPIVGDFEYFNWVNVLVEFDSLAVNTDKQVFGGFARAVYSKELNTDFREFFKSFDSWPDWAQKYCGIGANKGAEQAQKSAKKYVEKFQGEANVVLQMFNLSYQTLPIKIRHNIAGYDFDVAISDMKFTPRGSAFSLLYFMKIPEVDQVLPFGIRNVCMSGNPVQNGEFCLLADVEIPIGSKDKILLLKGGQSSDNKQKTYVKWSNKGFEGVRLEAALRLYKGSGITSTDTTKQFVEVGLSTDFVSWDNWIADINMENFKIDNAPDLTFSVKNAVYDHSTSINHSDYDKAVETLSKYDSELKANQEFTGFFFGELGCKTNIFASDEPLEFAVKNTIMNTKGISFSFDVNNILNIETGRAGGWQFSIDSMKMVLVNNIFREGGMKGKMKVPLNEDDTHMEYSCVLSYPKGKSLEFKLKVVPTISYNFLKYFKASLDETSSVNFIANSDGVKVTGKFDGKLSTRNCKLDMDVVAFQGMTISNWNEDKKEHDFVFKLGKWGFESYEIVNAVGEGIDAINDAREKVKNNDSKKQDENNKEEKVNFGDNEKNEHAEAITSNLKYKIELGPFKAGIGKIGFSTKNFEVGGKSNLNKDLQKAKEGGSLVGKTLTVTVPVGIDIGFGEKSMAGAMVHNKFSFDILYDKKFKALPKLDAFEYSLGKIEIGGNFSVVSLKGSIELYDKNPTYGEGAGGEIYCKFPMDITAKAQVYFGKKEKANGEDSKYFCVYGGLELGQASIPLFEPLELSGFGMGVWKNMQAKDDPSKPSGLSFEPMDGNDNGWGFKGEVLFGFNKAAGGKNSLTASAAISGQIEGGSLQSIQFLGKVSSLGTFDEELAKTVEKLREIMDDKGGINKNYCVNGELKLEYNPSEKQFSLDANCNAELLIAQAEGSINMFIDGKHKKWYVAAGIPDYDSKSILRAEAKFNIPGVNFNSLFKGYFITGNHLTYQMPPIPEKILELVKEKPSRSWPKDTAAGFFMGCRFSLNFEFKFGPLFAGLESMIGFDMSVKNEKGRSCADGTEIKGMKGYYLRGQLYAYFSGKVGVELKFFGKNRKWNLCAITCAGYLRGAMPSPTYLKGAIGVKGEILGGLIKFNTNAKFTLGNECQPPGGDPLKDFNLVEDVDPGYDTKSEAEERGSKKPSIFVSPKVRFSAPINKPFDLFDENENRRTYVFQHVRSEVRNVTGGDPVLLSTKTNNMISNKKEYYNELSYKFTEKLKPHTIYEFTIVCKVQEIVNGDYRNPIDGEGKYYSDNETMVTKTVYFKTDNLPDRIIPDNIRNAYPVNRQFETFVKDGEKGYIVLEYEQRNLIDKVATELGKDALFGVFKNRTSRNKPDILFHYEYKKNSNIGNEKKDAVIFDLKNLDKGCIYEVEFFVAEKFDKAATYQTKKITEKIGDVSDRSGKSSSGVKIIRTSSGKVIKIIQRDSQEETSDEDIVSYTGIVDVDKFSNSMKIDTSFAGKKTNTYQNSVNLNSANRANFIKQVLAQNLDAVDIPDGVNIDASSRFASISKNDGSNFKGAVRKGSDSKYDNLQSGNIMKSKFTDTSEIDKQKEEKTNIGAKAVIKSIFKYHFRTSEYDNLEQKLSEVHCEVEDYRYRYLFDWNSKRRQNSKLIYATNIPDAYIHVLFPINTTNMEIFGGKAFEESTNADYIEPNFILTNDASNRYSNNSVNAWRNICMPFLSTIRQSCSLYDLPITGTKRFDYSVDNYLFDYFTRTLVGNASIRDNRFKFKRKTRFFENRLYDAEIESGIVNRNSGYSFLSFNYNHNRIYYSHLLLASILANELEDNGGYYLSKELRNNGHFFSYTDKFLGKNNLLLYFSNLPETMWSLLKDCGKKIKFNSLTDPSWIYGRNHRYNIKLLKSSDLSHYSYSDKGYSTIFALERIWEKLRSKNNIIKFDNTEFYYPIGKHSVFMNYNKPIRPGASKKIERKLGDFDIK